jgi:FtsP/CotA-like multicopper oxidase with cupredoxin domain
MKTAISKTRLLLAPAALTLLITATAYAAAPGITGPTFNLTAQDGYLNQPDGSAVYSWGYGCSGPPAGFAPATIPGANCPTMQVPGPTLIVTEGQTVTVNLTNNLPTAAGNTSILFPGFQATSPPGSGVTGLLTQEATPGGTVTYTFSTTGKPGTHAYYSGTQGDLQVEMGLYGAIIVLPATVPTSCLNGPTHLTNLYGKPDYGTANHVPGFPEQDFRLSQAAYDHPATCYDREYLFQWAEMDPRIHHQAEAQVAATIGSGVCATAGAPGCSLDVQVEPYLPAFFVINGRSMPDLMDPNYAAEYPHQPYNGNPHIHPGEQMLIRTIGQGRWQHPFHEHANHVRILARDGNLILGSASNSTTTSNISYGGTSAPALAGLLMFNTDTTPGQAFDGIFYFTGRGLNWDPYGHHPGDTNDPLASLTCTADVNGYNTGTTAALNYYEWCQDHNKPVQANPFGDVAAGGPATLPDPNIFTNGAWYGGTPYLGPDASLRGAAPKCVGNPFGTATGNPPNAGCTNLMPANVQANPANERGWAFMWHSHNEREITTNNIFPGGFLMMLLVDSREFAINESQ